MVRELELDDVPELVRSLLDDPPRLERWVRRCSARRSPAPPTRSPTSCSRSRDDDRPPAVVRRDRRRGTLARTRSSRGRGAPRSAAGTASARRTSSRSPACRSRSRPSRVVPEGWEAVVSSAYPDVPGLRRRELLRELVAARPSIAVAGTHGKGTTAAMIAFALRETGRDPAWLIGAPVPQLGSNAGFGGGLPRRRGRRVGSHRLRARAGDRRRHEPRARPPHRVRIAGGARGRVRRVARRRRRRSCATRRRSTVSSRCRARTTG